MVDNDLEAKKRILRTTIEMLRSGVEPDKLTVRKIAELSGVGIGLINYHFGSKNELLSSAIGEEMSRQAINYTVPGNYTHLTPLKKLKFMLKSLYNLGEQYDKLVQFQITQNIISGDMNASLYLVPILKEIFNNGKDEIELRIIAMQILLPLQVASINPSKFFNYSGINLKDTIQRDMLIDRLIDNLLGENQRGG